MPAPLSPTDASPTDAPAHRGEARFRRLTLALFLTGFATFSLLYAVQPLLPEFSQEFNVGPAGASLALSLGTGMLAICVALSGFLPERVDRRRVMILSMVVAAVLDIGVAISADWGVLLVLRALEGAALGGLPAVAMAYMGDMVAMADLGYATGLFIAGNAFGGMTGRVLTGVLTHAFGWRAALGVLGGLGLLCALAFALLAPTPARRPAFIPGEGATGLGAALAAWGRHLRHPALPWLFALAFLFMGVFVTVYNYAGFRLAAPPYALDQRHIALIFSLYVLGIGSSSAAGALADRLGRRRVLVTGMAVMVAGVLLTVARPLPLVVAGVALLTAGFFISHAVASSWVGRLATTARGQASALYMLAYYLGSSIAGSVGGWFWSGAGWNGVAGFTLGLLLAAAGAAAMLFARLKPAGASQESAVHASGDAGGAGSGP